jgi:hypothetical protein
MARYKVTMRDPKGAVITEVDMDDSQVLQEICKAYGTRATLRVEVEHVVGAKMWVDLEALPEEAAK